VVSGEGASRRALLRGAGRSLIGLGALATLAGCGGQAPSGPDAVKKAARPVAETDVGILMTALALERRTVAAYIAAIPLLPHAQVKGAKAFLSEELDHTGELISLIKAAGGKAPPRGDNYDIGAPPRSTNDVLALLHSLERMQIAGYLKSIPRLSPGPVRAAVSSILANDAQHVAVLRAAQGQPALASAFVTGNE
jgi:Ferritin-like domain